MPAMSVRSLFVLVVVVVHDVTLEASDLPPALLHSPFSLLHLFLDLRDDLVPLLDLLLESRSLARHLSGIRLDLPPDRHLPVP